ncbi:glycosyltransferase [Acinetobacter schindleri]|nr:glycosyltransferase [Acinetobacter schindleri]
MSIKPILTVITIVYNHASGFKATAESIKNNKNNLVEWVVIDGLSKDGTVEIIGDYQDYIDKYVSEKDRGIADAFNKGIKLATGQFLLFLNAGDLLKIDIEKITSFLKEHDKAPCIVGKIEMENKAHGHMIPFWRQYMRNHLPHQAMFINKNMFEKYGDYDIDRKLGMDYEWSLRLKNEWSEIIFLTDVISIMEPGGVSVSNPLKTFNNYHNARVEHFGFFFLSFIVLIFYYFKVIILRRIKNILLKN